MLIGIFDRVIANLDVPTGTVPTNGSSGQSINTSRGPRSSLDMAHEELPAPAPFQCHVWNINNIGNNYTQEKYDALADGTAVV